MDKGAVGVGIGEYIREAATTVNGGRPVVSISSRARAGSSAAPAGLGGFLGIRTTGVRRWLVPVPRGWRCIGAAGQVLPGRAACPRRCGHGNRYRFACYRFALTGDLPWGSLSMSRPGPSRGGGPGRPERRDRGRGGPGTLRVRRVRAGGERVGGAMVCPPGQEFGPMCCHWFTTWRTGSQNGGGRGGGHLMKSGLLCGVVVFGAVFGCTRSSRSAPIHDASGEGQIATVR